MRVSVVPAQVTTVEDRIIGCLAYANSYFSELPYYVELGVVCRVAANDG